jgi:membrane protein DedA with SNARE-associated domain
MSETMQSALEVWPAGFDQLFRDPRLVHVGLFLAALIDSTGFPFPGRVVLIATGAATGDLWELAARIAAGAAGAVAGDHLWYTAGRFGAGARLTAWYCKLSLASGRCEQRARQRVERFGPLAIVVGRFVAGVRMIAGPVAGGGGLSYPRYLLFDVIGAVLWSGAFVGLGYLLGAQWRALTERYGVAAIVAAAVAMSLVGVVGIALVRLVRRRRHGPAGGALA